MISTFQDESKSADYPIRNFPNTLNGYELGKELGKGAFGKVLQAHIRDDVQRSKVAIKIVHCLLLINCALDL